MNIIGTGLSGLIGSRVVKVLTDYKFENLSLETGVDVTDFPLVTKRLKDSSADTLFHFAALTDVDKAESERDNKKGKYWKINVDATNHIVDVCKKLGKRVVFLTTDYVFDGKKSEYRESDIPNPQGWYAETKYEGEKIVLREENNLVLRIANPYCGDVAGKKDFVHKIVDRLDNGKKVSAPMDQIFVPTFVDDVIVALKVLLKGEHSGLFHVVGDTALTPYEACLDIVDILEKDKTQVFKTTFDEFFKNRAPRPFNANLKHDKITKLGVRMNSFREGLKLCKKSMSTTKL